MTHRTEIARGAARLRELHERVRATFPSRSEEWSRACAAFHAGYDDLAFPGGLTAGLEALKLGTGRAVELAVQFLEVDPVYFRSGYVKQEILQRLKGLELDADQVRRLNQVILGIVDTRDCREFRKYCQLARKIGDARLAAGLRERLSAEDRGVRRRARWVLEALDG